MFWLRRLRLLTTGFLYFLGLSSISYFALLCSAILTCDSLRGYPPEPLVPANLLAMAKFGGEPCYGVCRPSDGLIITQHESETERWI